MFVYKSSNEMFAAHELIDSINGGDGTLDAIAIDNNDLSPFEISLSDSFNSRISNVEVISLAGPSNKDISITLNDNASDVGINVISLLKDTSTEGDNTVDYPMKMTIFHHYWFIWCRYVDRKRSV